MNKCDLNDQRQISKEEGQMLAQNLGMTFFEISIKDDTGFFECFNYIVDEVININLDKYYKKIQTESLNAKKPKKRGWLF